jgi:hypothetical protein
MIVRSRRKRGRGTGFNFDKTEKSVLFSRTAFKKEEIVGSAERHHNTPGKGIVKPGFASLAGAPANCRSFFIGLP